MWSSMPNFSTVGPTVWPPIKNTHTQSPLSYRLNLTRKGTKVSCCPSTRAQVERTLGYERAATLDSFSSCFCLRPSAKDQEITWVVVFLVLVLVVFHLLVHFLIVRYLREKNSPQPGFEPWTSDAGWLIRSVVRDAAWSSQTKAVFANNMVRFLKFSLLTCSLTYNKGHVGKVMVLS